MADVYCRNCGVQLRRLLGRWWHVGRALGPVPCPAAEPERPEDLDSRSR
ncbi:hypothetical protein KIH74_22115 [Kineosporia sp. J2-2]|uniref:Uncharacterized protein n=1 Tax=Kineosporia corallincola TaxID=2835133 RepID=A0ABS5TKQ0_9ACTN|nr:hypothetical protein [Kineosporia corallincola]MBT0771651.1 hypothetical protein [Kineosporia corallincola]